MANRDTTTKTPHYRYDLLQWRRKRMPADKRNYEVIAIEAGLSLNAVWKTFNGKTDPSASTLKKIFEAVGLDPKYALSDLQESQFRRAVVGAAR